MSEFSKRKRKQRTPQQHYQQHSPYRCILNSRKAGRLLKIKEHCTHYASHYHHRMQTDNTPLEESTDAHPAPAVVIGITDNKTGKHKEKIYRQVTVIDNLFQVIAAGMRFQQMKSDYHYGSYATKPVEYLVMRL